jgi:hypothetical protein
MLISDFNQGRWIMKLLLPAALILAALTTSALAEPAKATKQSTQPAQTVAEPAKTPTSAIKLTPTGAIKLDKKQMEQIRAGGGWLFGG